ncbi:MAG: SWF/SNF helicase family protein, partial [Deltaproteobacteria bacterium]|nr:SWF/SNF helicase family protein [Deltaproteobacteria bacterium]
APVMVRRLKGELRKYIGSQIPERHTIQIDIRDLPPDAPELVLAEKLAEYSEILERRLSGSTNKLKAAGKLVAIALQKRLLSSIEAFAKTLAVHRRNSSKKLAQAVATPTPDAAAPRVLPLVGEDDEGEDLAEAQVLELQDIEVARATKAGASAEDDARARVLLGEMTDIAEQHRGAADAKVRALITWIREHQCLGLPSATTEGAAKWLPRRVLIFTEYTDTKNYLVNQLEAAIAGTDRADERILTIHGGMDEEAREAVKQAFNDDGSPVRILIGTDAAREGVNLQAECADLFHFDLPWNPARMEQRNGRIDRMLQPEDTVRCHYFVYAQRPEDAVLEALVKKTERIHRELGSLADVIDRRLTATLEGGITRGSARALADAILGPDPETTTERAQAVADELEQARDRELAAQLERLQALDQKASEHLDLKPDRLREVVDLGLKLAAMPALTPRSSPSGSFDVPPLDRLAGSDATWREIIDTLRPPRTRKMPEWEWRAKYPPRPVSFEPSTTLASETVQLHLQHKLTQRALAQFRAQAFGEDRLARVTVVVDPTHRRHRVLALARLSLYGAGASRLHEEILVAAAFWSQGDDPERLKAFETSEAEERALESLGAVLSREDGHPIAPSMIDSLMAHASKDEDALWPKVKATALRRTVWAEEKLRQRANVEAAEMTRILTAQRAAIARELTKREREIEKRERDAQSPEQLAMPWRPEEKEQKDQYDADTRHMKRRQADLERELEEEPKRIRALYEVKHYRLERVGLVYLWPSTS